MANQELGGLKQKLSQDRANTMEGWLERVGLDAESGMALIEQLDPEVAARLRELFAGELLSDLPVLENMDQYQQVQSVDFLRMLDEAHLFEDTDSDDDRGVQ